MAQRPFGLVRGVRGRCDGVHGHAARRDVLRRPRVVRVQSRVRLCPGIGGERCAADVVYVALCRVDLKKKPGYTNIAAVYPDMSFGWLRGWCVGRD
eukprot:COSAG02_NODE_33270_length_502_cov_27.925558_1_plen_95_part_01